MKPLMWRSELVLYGESPVCTYLAFRPLRAWLIVFMMQVTFYLIPCSVWCTSFRLKPGEPILLIWDYYFTAVPWLFTILDLHRLYVVLQWKFLELSSPPFSPRYSMRTVAISLPIKRNWFRMLSFQGHTKLSSIWKACIVQPSLETCSIGAWPE